MPQISKKTNKLTHPSILSIREYNRITKKINETYFIGEFAKNIP